MCGCSAGERPLPEHFGPSDFAAAASVSRETLHRLEAYVTLLKEWNARQNLVSRASLEDVWRRHVWDSAQLEPFLPPSVKTLADLGSGAGFPGLVLAALRADIKICLFEATAKKCRFLAEAAQTMQVQVDIRNGRIEDARPEGFDAVTARALAPLERLLPYAARFQTTETVNLFLKGQDVEGELKQATKSWRMNLQRHPSKAGPGEILEIRKLRHV